MMNFVEACKKISKGELVRRKGWKMDKTSVSGTPLTDHVGVEGRRMYYRTNLASEGGSVVVDFTPSMEDVLAKDWLVVK